MNTPTPEERASSIMMGGYGFDREAAIAAAIREAEDAAYERAAQLVLPKSRTDPGYYAVGMNLADAIRRLKRPAASGTGGVSPPPPWHAGPPPRFGDGRTVLVRLKQETREGVPCDAHGREYYGEPVAVRCWDDKLKTTLGSERVEYDEVTAWTEGPGGG